MRINFQAVLEFRILLGYLRVIMTSQRVLYGVHRYKQLAKGVSDFDTALTYALKRRSAFCTVETTIAGVYSGSVRRKGCFRLVTNRFWEVFGSRSASHDIRRHTDVTTALLRAFHGAPGR